MIAALVGAVFLASYLGTRRYATFAQCRGILAFKNARTLHDTVVPRGGGVVLAAVFGVAIGATWLARRVPSEAAWALGAGGSLAALLGWVDDIHELRQSWKLLGHVGLSVLAFGALFRISYAAGMGDYWIVAVLAMVFVPVWAINMYNFVDGIDGMAAAGAVFIWLAAMMALCLSGGRPEYILVLALLAASTAGFLLLNLPPARIFMGDAGSTFLGYCLGVLIVATVSTGQLTVWTWLAIVAYYVADTTTTICCRVVMVRKWYAGHRSHAYQNLARVGGSHARVTYGTALFNLCWALPMALWSVSMPAWAPAAAGLAVLPPMIWSLRFGPLYSKD